MVFGEQANDRLIPRWIESRDFAHQSVLGATGASETVDYVYDPHKTSSMSPMPKMACSGSTDPIRRVVTTVLPPSHTNGEL